VAFTRPQLFQNDQAFHVAYEHALVTSPANKAIVIGYEINKISIAVLLCMTLIAATIAGIAFGMRSKRAELGIAVSAAVFTLLSVLEVLALWLFK